MTGVAYDPTDPTHVDLHRHGRRRRLEDHRRRSDLASTSSITFPPGRVRLRMYGGAITVSNFGFAHPLLRHWHRRQFDDWIRRDGRLRVHGFGPDLVLAGWPGTTPLVGLGITKIIEDPNAQGTIHVATSDHELDNPLAGTPTANVAGVYRYTLLRPVPGSTWTAATSAGEHGRRGTIYRDPPAPAMTISVFLLPSQAATTSTQWNQRGQSGATWPSSLEPSAQGPHPVCRPSALRAITPVLPNPIPATGIPINAVFYSTQELPPRARRVLGDMGDGLTDSRSNNEFPRRST